MENLEILNLWKTYDKKLEDSLTLNKKLTQEIIKLKTKSLLSSMKPFKLFTLFVGVAWVGIGGIMLGNLFVFDYSKVSHFFLYSAVIQLLLTAISLVFYIYQMVLIRQVDISESVLKTQKKLASLKSSTLWVARILFLQLPVWTTFYWSAHIFEPGNMVYLIINGIITLLFCYVSIWLFLNIKSENKDKKWFKLIFQGKEWAPVIKSMELYKEMEEFKEKN